jgi:hypothetical protein
MNSNLPTNSTTSKFDTANGAATRLNRELFNQIADEAGIPNTVKERVAFAFEIRKIGAFVKTDNVRQWTIPNFCGANMSSRTRASRGR